MSTYKSILLRSYAAYIFISVAVIHIISIFWKADSVVFYSKPLLLILLSTAFILEMRRSAVLKKRMTSYVLLALLFSLLGDILLMFVDIDSIFFLLGLGAFLIAHLFYIFTYLLILSRYGQSKRPRRMALLSVAAYYLGFLSILLPSLEFDFMIAIVVYGFVISCMLLLSLLLYEENKLKTFMVLVIGSVLFVISDSLIAVNKFLWEIPYSGVLIMVTYILAQYLIVSALVNAVVAAESR